MSSSDEKTPTDTARPTVAVTSAASRVGTAGGELATPQGRTTIADAVVSKIAGVAAREVSGVHALGGGTARAFGAIRERIPGASSNVSQGVTVEVGERQAAIDLELVVEYGVAIAELAKAIRRNVIGALERMTGLEVVEVNVSVNDVHLPSDDDTEDQGPSQPPRVA
ncbi:MAG: Asp23/Gls24 family envelope stress response protein [Candidatus Dormibacteraeota bacterium]|uniref:Asp23/Gls24 family envelope stress response protein n=1 Tax=Candidatus Amunia macphersoniae TaxID=3127014 RepID=A0A934KL85_9BACT|nr:Asp23/Gls24 family envelope stress response protein [Candidatus Dormibacteraeota bacterium]